MIAKMAMMCYNTLCVQTGRRSKIGMSPSGKAPDFDSGIRRFESCHPSHNIIYDYKWFASSVGRATPF